MLNRDSFINVICPGCGKQFKERIGRLQEVSAFRHACGAYVEADLNELDKFSREQAYNVLAQFPLRQRP